VTQETFLLLPTSGDPTDVVNRASVNGVEVSVLSGFQKYDSQPRTTPGMTFYVTETSNAIVAVVLHWNKT
jgi:hypothetical protein